MVHRLQEQGEKILLPIIAFAACLVLSFVAGSLLLVPSSSKAVTNLTLVTPPELNVSTSGDIAIELTPTNTGTISAVSHIVTVGTNVPTGYSLTLGTTGTPSLTTTSGNMAIPTVLANNTWGYALAGLGGFDVSYATPTPATTSTWANPSAGETVKKTSDSSTSDITTVYYAAKADTSLAAGTYSNTVRYTATANISDISTPSIISVTPSSGTIAGGTAIQIVGTGFTVNDQSVTTAVTIDGANCTGVTISSNTPATGQDTVYCTTQAHALGEVDVAVTTWGGTVTKANGYRYKLDAVPMQEVTMENCTTERTLAYDVRDNRTYWVQKMDDGRCWMLTNLAYGGGGTDTYGDTKTISNGEAVAASYTDAYYYVPTGANPTDNPTDPSTSTDGGVTDPQYGYLYNWCAAMGAQTGTTACSNASTPADPDTSISICPSGWRLPTGDTGGEFQVLNDAENSGSTSSPSGLLSSWLGQYAGGWNGGFSDQGGYGYYWSSTQYNASNAYILLFTASAVYSGTADYNESYGRSVRCVMADSVAKTGDDIQTVTTDTCPTTRTRVRDARDDATYWIQKMEDGKCWMLTNLAYGGGGANTYGDVKAITVGTATTYTEANYYIPTDANRTTDTTDPSTSTDGGATNPQYGYLYNWCAAMGSQTNTSACADTTTPEPNTSISICPSGWRLPTSNTNGEFQQLTDAIGATTNGSSGGTTGSTNLMNSWLATYSGYWYGSFDTQGRNGYYWSSTQHPSYSSYAYYLGFYSDSVGLSNTSNKQDGFAVRCVAV